MAPMSVYIGGLGEDTQKDDLEREFGRFGNITKVWVARNPPGFAFIDFENDDDADEAIKEMNGATINGSEIRVDASRGGSTRDQGRGRGDGGFRGDRRGRGGGGFRGGRDRSFDSGFRRSGGGERGFSRGGPRYRGGGGGYDSGSGYRSRSPIAQRFLMSEALGFSCGFCNVYTPSEENFKAHLNGAKHLQKKIKNPYSKSWILCHACKIKSRTEDGFGDHINGTKHLHQQIIKKDL